MACFSERLKQLREEYNWSSRQLAKFIDISHSAIIYYESGARKPKREALEALADVFNVDMGYLLGESDIRNAYQLSLQPSGKFGQLDETQAKLVALYDKIADKEGFIRFTERLSALSEEQQRFVFENLLQGR